MNTPQSVKDIFNVVIELPPGQQMDFLDRACGDDPSLRARVEELLVVHDSTGAFLAAPTFVGPRSESDDRAPLPGAEGPGSMIGRYRLLEAIGEGGFGTVYMAEQQEPVRRKVALKIIKLGMDTKQVIARFEAERQALAMMDHPNIARVLDAGATDTGRPYFVMELVKGVPITEYCDTESLSTKDRLDLFITVCHAVQHAHQKGIIHRDIKPSNVMVTLQDGKPVPKVIDFGIAKATNRELTDKTLFTEYRQLIGTPQYMSPEQAEMTGLDIDTRSDIYSVGVLLYELLTGTTPFDPQRLRSAALGEIQRIIREEEPDKPSTRLSDMSRQRGTDVSPVSDEKDRSATHGRDGRSTQKSSIQYIAKHRRTEPAHLARQLRGDLDWIIMKALEKERARRYETANGLALDIERHLKHEPVLAGPPGAAYRAKKFCHRNKGLIGAVAAVFVVLIAGVIVSTSQYLEAEAARVQGAKDRDAAIEARDDSDAVVKFLSDMLAAVDPGKQGKDVSVRAVLDEAAKTIGEKFRNKPLIEARLRFTIWRSFYALGLYDTAEPHVVAAVSILRRELGPRHPDTLRSMNAVTITLERQGKFSGAAESHRKSYEIQRRILGQEHPSTLHTMNNLALALHDQGKHEEAEKLDRKTLEIRRRVLGEEHPDTLRSMGNLGVALCVQGRYAEAEKLSRQTLAIRRRVLGQEHPDTLQSINNLACAVWLRGRYAEAEKLSRQTLEIMRRVLGGEHPDTLTLMMTLAIALFGQGQYAEAEKLYRKTLEIQRRVLGEEHPKLGFALVGLAEVLLKKGNPREARGLTDEALRIRKAALPDDHAMLAYAHSVLGECLTALGRYDEAEPLVLENYEKLRAIHGETGAETRKALPRIVKLYEAWDAAEPGKGYADKAATWRAELPNGD